MLSYKIKQKRRPDNILNKRISECSLNIVKCIYHDRNAIMLNSENVKAFPSKIRGQGSPILLHFSKINHLILDGFNPLKENRRY